MDIDKVSLCVLMKYLQYGLISVNIATGLVTSSQAMETSIDGNLAMMYTQFHMKNAILGAKLLQLSHTKGWLPVSTTPA